MKIGLNASFLRKPDTGIGQVTRGLIDELIHGHSRKNEYFLYLEQDIDLALPKNFHKRVFLPKLWRRDDLVRKVWWEKFLLPARAQKDDCEIFLSPYPCPTFFSKKIRHKMIVHDMIWKVFPEYLDNWRKKIYAFLAFQAVRDADEIYSISEWSKRDIHKYLKILKEKIVVAYPSVDPNFSVEERHDRDNSTLEKYEIFGRYIFYVGGFDFRKNISGLLEAYSKLIERYDIDEVKLVLAGEDKSKLSPLFTNIQKEIERFGLRDVVRPIGFVEQADLPALYRQAELFVLPSLYEGFGLPALEAMASGAPTAVSKSSALPEVCGDAVLYFNPYEPEEMARVMGKIIRNNSLRHKLSEKGRARAKNFSWQKFVEIIMQ